MHKNPLVLKKGNKRKVSQKGPLNTGLINFEKLLSPVVFRQLTEAVRDRDHKIPQPAYVHSLRLFVTLINDLSNLAPHPNLVITIPRIITDIDNLFSLKAPRETKYLTDFSIQTVWDLFALFKAFRVREFEEFVKIFPQTQLEVQRVAGDYGGLLVQKLQLLYDDLSKPIAPPKVLEENKPFFEFGLERYLPSLKAQLKTDTMSELYEIGEVNPALKTPLGIINTLIIMTRTLGKGTLMSYCVYPVEFVGNLFRLIEQVDAALNLKEMSESIGKEVIASVLPDIQSVVKELCLGVYFLEDRFGLPEGLLFNDVKAFLERKLYRTIEKYRVELTEEDRDYFPIARANARNNRVLALNQEVAEFKPLRRLINEYVIKLDTVWPLLYFSYEDLKFLEDKENLKILGLDPEMEKAFLNEIDLGLRPTLLFNDISFFANVIDRLPLVGWLVGNNLTLKDRVLKQMQQRLHNTDGTIKGFQLESQVLATRNPEYNETPERLTERMKQVQAQQVELASIIKKIRCLLENALPLYLSQAMLSKLQAVKSGDTYNISKLDIPKKNQTKYEKELLGLARTINLLVKMEGICRGYLQPESPYRQNPFAKTFHYSRIIAQAIAEVIAYTDVDVKLSKVTRWWAYPASGLLFVVHLGSLIWGFNLDRDVRVLKGYLSNKKSLATRMLSAMHADGHKVLDDISKALTAFVSKAEMAESKNKKKALTVNRKVKINVSKAESAESEDKKKEPSDFVRQWADKIKNNIPSQADNLEFNDDGILEINDDDPPLLQDAKCLLNGIYCFEEATGQERVLNKFGALKQCIRWFNRINLQTTSHVIREVYHEFHAHMQKAIDEQLNTIFKEELVNAEKEEEVSGLQYGVSPNKILTEQYQDILRGLGFKIHPEDEDAFAKYREVEMNRGERLVKLNEKLTELKASQKNAREFLLEEGKAKPQNELNEYLKLLPIITKEIKALTMPIAILQEHHDTVQAYNKLVLTAREHSVIVMVVNYATVKSLRLNENSQYYSKYHVDEYVDKAPIKAAIKLARKHAKKAMAAAKEAKSASAIYWAKQASEGVELTEKLMKKIFFEVDETTVNKSEKTSTATVVNNTSQGDSKVKQEEKPTNKLPKLRFGSLTIYSRTGTKYIVNPISYLWAVILATLIFTIKLAFTIAIFPFKFIYMSFQSHKRSQRPDPEKQWLHTQLTDLLKQPLPKSGELNKEQVKPLEKPLEVKEEPNKGNAKQHIDMTKLLRSIGFTQGSKPATAKTNDNAHPNTSTLQYSPRMKPKHIEVLKNVGLNVIASEQADSVRKVM